MYVTLFTDQRMYFVLKASNIWRILAEGAKVGVEVTRSASKAKGGRVSVNDHE